MSKTCSGKKLVTILVRVYGFSLVGQKGSYVKLRRSLDGEVRITIVPLHSELAMGTLKSALDLAGIDYRDLLHHI